MHAWTRSLILVSIFIMFPSSTSAEVILELIGSTELTVEQAFPHSPTELYPIDGQSLVVWAEMTNTGAEVFEAIVLGGYGGARGINLWRLPGTALWDASADPDDPLVMTPSGYMGIALNAGESFSVPVLEVWGIEVDWDPPYTPAPIASCMTYENLTIEMLAGLDHDNPGQEDPDTFVTLDSVFTVTVVPEPGGLVLILAGSLAGIKPRRRAGLP